MLALAKSFLNKRLTLQFVFIGLFFLVIRVVTAKTGIGKTDNGLLASVAVLYSLFISFVISSQRSRYDAFFENNRAESSVLYSIHLFSEVFPKSVRDGIRSLLDSYLIMQMDYRLTDFKNTDRGFTELAEYCLRIKTTNDAQAEAKDKILDLLPSGQEKRYSMQTLLSERVAKSEWITTLSLYFATIYSFLVFETPDTISIVVGALVCTAATMLILVLYKLDTLAYRSNEKISDPIQKLFLDLELLPYYSEPTILNGQARPIKGVPVRVARYPNEYPDMTGKKIEIRTY